MKSRPRRAKRAAPAVRKLPAKGRRPSEASRRILVGEDAVDRIMDTDMKAITPHDALKLLAELKRQLAAPGTVTRFTLAEQIADRIRRTEISFTTPLQAKSLLRSFKREIQQEDIIDDRRLREAGWIPVTEQLPPLGEVIQEAEAEGGRGCVTVPLADRFPPDDLSTLRRESEVVLALVAEDWDDWKRAMGPVWCGREPRLYVYIEYADGRKIWDDWSGCSNDYSAALAPTYWFPLPGGVGACEREEDKRRRAIVRLGPPSGVKVRVVARDEEAAAQR